MVDCRAVAQAHPGDYPARFGSLYRRVVGRVTDSAANLIGDPWKSELLALTPADRSRVLQIARLETD
jgi:hypothetical protein